MHIGPDGQEWRYAGSGGKEYSGRNGLTAAHVVKWLTGQGATGSPQQVDADAAEILLIINDFIAGKTVITTTRFAVTANASVKRNRVFAYVAAWPIFWLVVYAGGIALYLRIRRRQRAHPPAAYVP